MNPSSSRSFRALALLSFLGLMGNAYAHITLQNQKGEAGAYYRAVLQVGHGCEAGSPIKQIIVDIPDGVLGAKPMAKAGWKIEVDKAKLAKPYTMHGVTITDYVTQIRWTGGPLADAHYDEFVLVAKLPDQAGPLYWKVSQICETGRLDWAETPAAGKKLSDYKLPAAVMEIIPQSGTAHHH